MADYSPASPPPNIDLEALRNYVERELNKVAQTFHEQDILYVRVLTVAPPKPREGYLAYADGTNWNPGSGRGIYEYRSGAWAKL